MAVLAIGGVTYVALNIFRAAVGQTVCDVSFQEAQKVIVMKACLPESGTKYCVFSNVRGTRAYVNMSESMFEKWLLDHGVVAQELTDFVIATSLCSHEAWTIERGKSGIFDCDGVRVYANYDSERGIAMILAL